MLYITYVCFFFNQKTAYEMRISDWSSYVCSSDHVKKFIDFAAANNIRGVLVEGWNPGWNGDWLGHGNDFDFATPTADFDADGLARYAASKGVHLIGHHETGGAVSHYESQLDKALDRKSTRLNSSH